MFHVYLTRTCVDRNFWPHDTATCEPDVEAIELFDEWLGFYLCKDG